MADQIFDICTEISNLTIAASRNGDETICERIELLHGLKDSVEGEMSRECSEAADALESRHFDVADVAVALPEGAVLCEFVKYKPYDFAAIGNDEETTGAPRYPAFTLNNAGSVSLADLGTASEIDSLVALARRMIRDSGSDAKAHSRRVAELEQELNEATGKLYDLVFRPLLPGLSQDTDLYISPDGELSLLPLEILIQSSGRFLIEDYSISYVSSGRDLLRLEEGHDRSGWALVMADPDFDLSDEDLVAYVEEAGGRSSFAPPDRLPSRSASECLYGKFVPLPYSSIEADTIAKTLREMAEIDIIEYCGAGALEDILKTLTSPPWVLHLATHGFFCEDLDGLECQGG